MNDHKQFTRGYVKGWTDRHNHGQELPVDLSNAINELQRLLNREEVGLPVIKIRKPLYVSGARKTKVQRFGRKFAELMAERKRLGLHQRTGLPLKKNPGDPETAQYVFGQVKKELANGPLMPREVITNLLASGDARVRNYILAEDGGRRQRIGQLLIYYAKCDNPQVKRVSAGYELINGGAQ